MKALVKPTEWKLYYKSEVSEIKESRIAIVNKKMVLVRDDGEWLKFYNAPINKDKTLGDAVEFYSTSLLYLKNHIERDLVHSCEEFDPNTGMFRWGSATDYNMTYEEYRCRWFRSEFNTFAYSDNESYTRRNRYRSHAKFTKLQWDYLLEAVTDILNTALDKIIYGIISANYPEATIKREEK